MPFRNIRNLSGIYAEYNKAHPIIPKNIQNDIPNNTADNIQKISKRYYQIILKKHLNDITI